MESPLFVRAKGRTINIDQIVQIVHYKDGRGRLVMTAGTDVPLDEESMAALLEYMKSITYVLVEGKEDAPSLGVL